MTTWDLIRAVVIVCPILIMILVGLILVVRSGEAGLASVAGLKRTVGNISEAALMLAGCLVGIVVIQQLVGFKMNAGW